VPSGSAARKPITIIDDGTTSNDNRLGAVCDLLQAIEQLSDRKSSNSKWPDDLLVMAGDNLLDFSLAGFIQYGKEKNATCVMRYYEAEEAKLHKTGVAEISDDGRLIAMEEKPAQPKSHWCIPAFYYYTREDTHLIKKGIESGCGIDAPGSLIAWLCGQTPVYSWEMPGKRFDIGSLDTYYQACELAKAGKL
jgi:glucose-1-phosphate thymidylyltransferase